MFRVYLGPLSGGKPYVNNSWYLLFILDECLFSWLDGYSKIGTYCSFYMTVCCPGWMESNQDNRHLKRIISANCSIHTVVPPDDGPRYARNT